MIQDLHEDKSSTLKVQRPALEFQTCVLPEWYVGRRSCHLTFQTDKIVQSSNRSTSATSATSSISSEPDQVPIKVPIPLLLGKQSASTRPGTSRTVSHNEQSSRSRASSNSSTKRDEQVGYAYHGAPQSISGSTREGHFSRDTDMMSSTSRTSSRLSRSRLSEVDSDADVQKNQIMEFPSSQDGRTQAAKQIMAPPPRRSIETRKADELEAKLRLMEKRRMEDREKLKSLERLQAERDRFETVIQKLQAKYQPQQQDLAKLRRQAQASEAKLTEMEAAQAEHESILEMATLDREMAEETAEALRTELSVLKAKAEELDEEVKLLREENAELGKDMNPNERAGQSWLQLERSNQRLKEALMRLRDVTQTQEAELKSQITMLKSDIKGFVNIDEQYGLMKERLQQADAAIEDLKVQLDAALGAEELVEELTERNNLLNEKVHDLTLTVEDLQSLKELNDELEQSHIVAEKYFHEEIDRRDTAIADYQRRAAALDERTTNQERIITKLKSLVISLQKQIKDLAMTEQTMTVEAQDADANSRAMHSLSLRLRSAIRQAETQMLELELCKFDAQQTKEHVLMAESFLPQPYQSDRPSILVYFQFNRIAYKTRMLQKLLQSRLSSQDAVGLDEVLVAFDAMGQMVEATMWCDSLIDHVSHCTVEKFQSYAATSNETQAIERAIDGHIEAWKANQLGLGRLIQDVQRFASHNPSLETCADYFRHVTVLSGLAKRHIERTPHTNAQALVTRACVVVDKLEQCGIVMDRARLVLEEPTKEYQETSVSAIAVVMNDFQATLGMARDSWLAARKVHEALTNLKDQNLAPSGFSEQNSMAIDESCKVVTFQVQRLLQQICSMYEENEAEEEYAGLLVALSHDQGLFKPLMESLHALLSQIDEFQTNLNSSSKVVELDLRQTPWTVRAHALQSAEASTSATAEELVHMKSTLENTLANLYTKDRSIEEQKVKIELLESRMQDAAIKADRIKELETLLERTSQREYELKRRLAQQSTETEILRAAKEQLEALAAEFEETGTGKGSAANLHEMESLRAEVRDLQAAVRLLRRSDATLRYSEEQMAWLKEPIWRKLMQNDLTSQARSAKEKQGLQLFEDFLEMVSEARLVNLESLSGDKLAWRPGSEKTAYQVAIQMESWAQWNNETQHFSADEEMRLSYANSRL